MPLVTVTEVSKLFGAKRVLDGASFKIERGERVALVGANGSGKSTLLRIMAGLELPDSGQVSLSRNAIVTYVSQHAEFAPDATLWQAMLEPFAAAIDAQAAMREMEPQLKSDSHESLREEYRRLSGVAEHGGYDYESRIERVLVGLELPRDVWNTPTTRLSGGQKTRANLARALLLESDLLLLDEPTNHLDIAAIEWLEKFLSAYHQAFVVVAHDRYFLDKVSRRTLELENLKLEDYPASYAGFLRLREERHARAALVFERQQEQIAATEDFVRRFGAGQRSKEAKGRQKRLDRLERVERPSEDRKLKLRVKSERSKGDVALTLTGLAVGYASSVLVELPRELRVPHGARVAIVGPNGSGKTTLARTLMGEIPPVAGSFKWAGDSSPAYYAQSTTSSFSVDVTVLQALQDRFGIGEETARSYLGRFLFSGDEVSKRIGDLSGGEQSRVALAELLFSHPNAMLLDEPTNHLDIPAREALEEALSGFSGSLFLISHDRFLIDRLATHVWSIENGRLVVYDGTWSDFTAGRYRRNLEYGHAPSGPPPPPPEVDQLPDSKSKRSAPEVAVELNTVGSSFGDVLNRAELMSATAPVDRISSDLDSLIDAERELRRLTDEFLSATTSSPHQE